MGNYKKINEVNLARFNNAEYLSFMNHVLDLANGNSGGGDSESPDEISLLTGSDGIPELGLTKEFLDTYEADLLAMADVVDESRTSQETEQMALHDTNRDNLAIYIITRISRAGTLPLEAERDAGKYLYKIIKPYNGIARLPMAQETAKIKGLLLDLRKDENKPYVTTLGLDAYLAELEKENNAYDRLSQQRVQNRTTSKKESGTNLRKRIDVYYDDLTLLAQSYGVAKPSEKATAFIAALNQLIAETTGRLQPAHGRLQETGARSRAYTRAYARRRLREPGRDLTVTSLPPTRKREIKREGKQFPFSFYSVYSRRKFLKQSDMETTTSLKTFEVTIPEKYADILKKFITSLEGKVKAQKKSGLDEALEDVKAGRIYHAESTKDLMKQILG